MGQTIAAEYNASPAAMTEGQKRNLRTTKSGALVSQSEFDVISVVPVLDTSVYANNDVLFIAIEVPNFFRIAGGRTRLVSATLFDGDNQGTQVTVFFSNNATTPGTINAAISAADTVMDDIEAYLNFTTYEALINSQVCHKANVNSIIEGAAGATSVYCWGAVRSGTPTYTASGMLIRLAVEFLD